MNIVNNFVIKQKKQLIIDLIASVLLLKVIILSNNMYLVNSSKEKEMDEFLDFKPILPDNDPELIKKYYTDNNIPLPDIPEFKNYIESSETGIKVNENPFDKPTSTINQFESASRDKTKQPGRDTFFKNDLVTPIKSKHGIINEINSMEISNEDKTYLEVLAARESSFRPNITNDLGYFGLYQFGKPALKDVGYTIDDFRNSTMNQHIGALKLANKNDKSLTPIIKAYNGKTFKGNKITRNGIRAAAHLLGAGTVKDYFNGTTNTKLAKKGFVDGNGVHITEYLNLFT